MAQPAILLSDGEFLAHNCFVYTEGGWPYGVDGRGERVLSFPADESIIQPEARIRNHRPDDYGFGYHCQTLDLDRDEREEVIIYDRRHVWVFKP